MEQPELLPWLQQCPTTNKHNPETKKGELLTHWHFAYYRYGLNFFFTHFCGSSSHEASIWQMMPSQTFLSFVGCIYKIIYHDISNHPHKRNLSSKNTKENPNSIASFKSYTYTVYLLPSFWAAKTTFCRSISPLLWKIERKTCFVSTWLGSQYHHLMPCRPTYQWNEQHLLVGSRWIVLITLSWAGFISCVKKVPLMSSG